MNESRSWGAPSTAPSRSVPTLTEVLDVRSPLHEELEGPLPSTVNAGEDDLPTFSEASVISGVDVDPNLDEPASTNNTRVMLPDGSLAVRPGFAVSDLEGGNRITERVLSDVQRHVDLMLEYRLRETLTPALARMTDMFIRDTRNELASTLREIVARAVQVELARMRRE